MFFYKPEKEDKFAIAHFMEFKKTYEKLNMLFPFGDNVKVQQG